MDPGDAAVGPAGAGGPADGPAGAGGGNAADAETGGAPVGSADRERLAVGVDGCRGGWISVAIDGAGRATFGVDRALREVLGRWPDARLLLVDIPIGLIDGPEPRRCDREARRRLGPRASSVFPAPARATLAAADWDEAQRLNRAASGRGLSRQGWNLVPKIREVDEALRALRRERPTFATRVREAHPELAFMGLNRGIPMAQPKRSAAGREERIRCLERHFAPSEALVRRVLDGTTRSVLAPDDVIDALALAVTARLGQAEGGPLVLDTLPATPELDPTGLPMEMVFPRPSSGPHFPGDPDPSPSSIPEHP